METLKNSTLVQYERRKIMKKMFSLALALIMALALSVPAFAQDVGTDAADKATITISNAAKGETYTIYKLFDATVAGDGPINYTGTIPSSLADYFEADSAGNITAKAAAVDGDKMSAGLETALKAWAATATKAADAVSDGSVLNFNGLDYGYYVVTTSQGEQTISVDSTNPDVTIVDKNSTTPNTLVKTATDGDEFDGYKVGDTVTYTVSFKTSNYDGAGTEAKEIFSYTIEDTLPDFLDDVTVTSIIVDNDADAATTNDQTDVTAQFVGKKIVIDWYDETAKQFLYDNGASVTIVYTAVLTDVADIDGEGNTNEVTLTWGEGNQLKDEETIYTYAFALKKINEKGEALADATFQLPFYVQAEADEDGAYIYAGTEAGDGLVNTLTTPASGEITIKGVQNEEYSIVETVAPNGYNKLVDPVVVTPVQLEATTTSVTKWLDEDGNVVNEQTKVEISYINEEIAATPVFVVNKAGIELPSTGGVGTTIFYVVGGLMMAAAGVLLVTKKKVANEEE